MAGRRRAQRRVPARRSGDRWTRSTILNLRRYPQDLTTGEQLVIDQDDLRGVYRNLIVSMVVQGGPGGFNRLVPRPAPDQDRNVKVAFGAYEIHELSHALGMLHDEYIHHRTEDVTYRDPVVPSVFSLSNVRFSDRVDQIPWLHLSPWGLERRSAGGKRPPRWSAGCGSAAASAS